MNTYKVCHFLNQLCVSFNDFGYDPIYVSKLLKFFACNDFLAG